jgi:hypothetical protein
MISKDPVFVNTERRGYDRPWAMRVLMGKNAKDDIAQNYWQKHMALWYKVGLRTG